MYWVGAAIIFVGVILLTSTFNSPYSDFSTFDSVPLESSPPESFGRLVVGPVASPPAASTVNPSTPRHPDPGISLPLQSNETGLLGLTVGNVGDYIDPADRSAGPGSNVLVFGNVGDYIDPTDRTAGPASEKYIIQNIGEYIDSSERSAGPETGLDEVGNVGHYLPPTNIPPDAT